MTLDDQIEETAEGWWVISGDTHLSKWVALHKKLNVGEQEISLFGHLIPKGGTVVDAGASIGDHAHTYAQLVGPTGHVFAFEPNPAACLCLGRNMAKFTWVQVRRKALGDGNSEAIMLVEENAGASYINPKWILADGACFTRVKIRKLDRYLPLMERCDLIHFDLEGYETKALAGAAEVLAKFRPAIVLEVNHACLARLGLTEADVRSTLAKHGYSWSELEASCGPHNEQRNLLCTPK